MSNTEANLRELLRKLPYRFRRWLRRSELGYRLHADKWMPRAPIRRERGRARRSAPPRTETC